MHTHSKYIFVNLSMRIILSILLSVCFTQSRPWPPAATGTCGPDAGGIGDSWEPGLGLCLQSCSNPQIQLNLADPSNYDNWWEWADYSNGNPCSTGSFMGNECCYLCGDGQIDNEEECDPGSTIGPYVYDPSSDNTCACNDDCTCNESDSMEINTQIIPDNYSISSIYPNPFNPTTTISFSIPEFGLTTITAYDINGRELETLTNEVLSIGNYSLSWNASNYPSGVYLIRMESGDFTQTQKVVLVK